MTRKAFGSTLSAGFSLIELIVSVAAGAIIIVALSEFTTEQSKVLSESERKKRAFETGKEVISYITRDYNKGRNIEKTPKGVTVVVNGKKRSYTTVCKGSTKKAKLGAFDNCSVKCGAGRIPTVQARGGDIKDKLYPQITGVKKKVFGAVAVAICSHQKDDMLTVVIETFYDSADKKIKKNRVKKTYSVKPSNEGIEFQ